MRNGKYSKSTGYKSMALLLAMVLLVGCAIGGTLAWLTDKTDEVTNTFTTSNIDIDLKETEREYKMVPGWTIDKDPVVTVDADSEDCYLFIKVEKSGGDVTVGEGEAKKTYTFDSFIAYAIDSGWTQLKDGSGKDVAGVYYKVIDEKSDRVTSESGKEVALKHHVLGAGTYTYNEVEYKWAQDQVLTKPEVTKEMMEAVAANNGAKQPTLTFTAYASQLWKTNKPTGEGVTDEQTKAAQFTPYQAWLNVTPSTT